MTGRTVESGADVPSSTIDAVLAWVGDDPARRAEALSAEQARPESERRPRLLEQLEPAEPDPAAAGVVEPTPVEYVGPSRFVIGATPPAQAVEYEVGPDRLGPDSA